MEPTNLFPTSQEIQVAPSSAADDKINSNLEQFIVEELLNLPNDDIIADATFDTISATAVDSCNSSSFSMCDPNIVDHNIVAGISPPNTISPVSSDANFSDDLCVPYDDLDELEWLSNFVEESFSSEDLQKMQLLSGVKGPNEVALETREFHSMPEQNTPSVKHEFYSIPDRNSPPESQEFHSTPNQLHSVLNQSNPLETREFRSVPYRASPIFNMEVSVPAKARSKKTRAPPCDWRSRLHILSSLSSSEESEPELLLPNPITTPPSIAIKKPTSTKSASTSRRKDNGDGSGGDGRRCLHCATDKTPQWRTGPNGPKTLCNACGVRYKSGRLVPEYRPAASPTFVLAKHSNSHRKVLELRRQKEMMRVQQHHQPHQHQHQHQHHHQQFLQHHHHHPNVMFDIPNNDDYLIYQHVGPDYRQMI